MIKRLLFLLLFFVSGIFLNSFSMEDLMGDLFGGEGKGKGKGRSSNFLKGVGTFAGEALNDLERHVRHKKEENERNTRKRIIDLNENLAYAKTDIERQAIMEERTILIRQAAKERMNGKVLKQRWPVLFQKL